MTDLTALLDEMAEQYASRVALVYRPRYRTLRWTFGELRDRVGGVARALLTEGVGPGDRILLFSGNSPHWAAAFFAILARGAVAVPLNPRSPVEQLQRIIASCEPKLLLCSSRMPWPGGPIKTVEIEAVAAMTTKAPPPARVPIQPGQLAEIVYTSGTTGDPKGVMLTHANLLACVHALGEAVPLLPGDAVLSIVPLFHLYGQMAGLLYPLSRGCALTYVPSLSSRVILNTFSRTPASYLVAVPEFLKTVMDRLEDELLRRPVFLRTIARRLIRRRAFQNLDTIVSGGAPLSAELETKWRAFGFEVLQGYGLTETSPMIACNTRHAHRFGSVGKPIPGVSVRVAPDGEILVKGPNVMAGYYRDEARTRQTIQDGWLKTDDSGKFDEDGFLYVFGRKKYMILGPGGENVFPEDIEAELSAVAGVRDSAVVGLERGGRVAIHAVLLSDRGDGDAIVAEANRRLASHQQIMGWSLWPEVDFPRSATRKVRKEEVIRWLATQQATTPRAVTVATPLTRLIAQVTRTDPMTIDDSTHLVADLHLDSLLRIELVSRIEEEFNLDIPENLITDVTTVGELKALVEERNIRSEAALNYPRWSLGKGSRLIRPAIQHIGFFSWLSWLCDLNVEGRENLEDLHGPVIFMANHRSYLDGPVLVQAMPRRWRAKLAIAAAYDPLYERFPKIAPLAELSFNTYPFGTRLSENIKPSLEYTGSLLDDGWSVLIFPEGRMNRSEQALMPLRGGTGILAVEMQVPIVPMTIAGTERILPPDMLMPRRRGRVDIRFGKPLTFAPSDRYGETTRLLERAIGELLMQK
ncbi:MAG TPA: AMP-binding protein [Methylococcaceae bacterium]|nr:AMP-binding protein [Methylococcaceae bacterium]